MKAGEKTKTTGATVNFFGAANNFSVPANYFFGTTNNCSVPEKYFFVAANNFSDPVNYFFNATNDFSTPEKYFFGAANYFFRAVKMNEAREYRIESKNLTIKQSLFIH